MKYGPVEHKCMKLAIFAAEVDAFGQVLEKAFVQFAASKASIQFLWIHASHHGTKMVGVKRADEFAGITPPDGEERRHAHAGEITLSVDAQVFEKDVAERNASN